MPGETLTRRREVAIGPLDQIPRGEGRTFQVNGTRVAVFRTHADEVFATEPDCPHKQGPLADGMLGGTTLLCPLHDLAFDLRTGQALDGTNCTLKTYKVHHTENGTLLVALRE